MSTDTVNDYTISGYADLRASYVALYTGDKPVYRTEAAAFSAVCTLAVQADIADGRALRSYLSGETGDADIFRVIAGFCDRLNPDTAGKEAKVARSAVVLDTAAARLTIRAVKAGRDIHEVIAAARPLVDAHRAAMSAAAAAHDAEAAASPLYRAPRKR